MGTHRIQISLKRATRRPHRQTSLVRAAGLFGFLAGVVGGGSVGLGVLALGWGPRGVLVLGLTSAGASAVSGALLARPLSTALDSLALAARRAAVGDTTTPLPSGPGAEVNRLAAALTRVAGTVGSIREEGALPPPLAGSDGRADVGRTHLHQSGSNDHTNAGADTRC